MLCAFVGAGLGNTLRMKLIKHNYTLFLNVAASVSLACLVYALLFNFLENLFWHIHTTRSRIHLFYAFHNSRLSFHHKRY